MPSDKAKIKAIKLFKAIWVRYLATDRFLVSRVLIIIYAVIVASQAVGGKIWNTLVKLGHIVSIETKQLRRTVALIRTLLHNRRGFKHGNRPK